MKSESARPIEDILVAIVLFALCGLIWWAAQDIAPPFFDPLGSAAVPKALAIVISVSVFWFWFVLCKCFGGGSQRQRRHHFESPGDRLRHLGAHVVVHGPYGFRGSGISLGNRGLHICSRDPAGAV